MTDITYSAINPDTGPYSGAVATVTDGIVLLDQTTYLMTDPFAEIEFITDASSADVTYYNDIFDQFPTLTGIGVYVDGNYRETLVPTAEGSTTTSVSLGAGQKRVSFVNGPTSGVGVANTLGSFVTNIDFTDGEASPVSDLPSNRLMFYGDSIAVGQGSSTFQSSSWMMKVRRANYPYQAACDARGSRTLHDDTSTAPLQTTFVTNAVSRNPEILWMAIGTNDYGLERWSASDFGTAYAGLLDALNTSLPSLQIYCQSPIVRVSEVANTFGDTLQDYRDAISTAVSTRTGFATYINGASILTTAELQDNVHPNQDGHDLIYAEISSQLGIDIPQLTGSFDMNFWRGAVEPAENGASGNEVQLWRGAVEPAATASADALIGGVTRSVTRTLTRGVTEGWDWGA